MKKAFWLTIFLFMVCLLAVSACKSMDASLNDSSSQQTNLETGDNNADIPSICNHTFGEWNTVKQPTCKDEGKRARACTQCKETEEEVIQKSEVHTPVIDAPSPATCKNTGLSEGSHCSVCNEVLVAQTVIPMLEHTVIIDEAILATCSSFGLSKGSHCSVCNAVIEKRNVVPKLEHTVVIDEATKPTCSSFGFTEGSHCSVCNTVIDKQNTVPKLEHTVVIDEATEPTCSSFGLTEGSHCSVCNTVIDKQMEIPTLPHTFIDGFCFCGAQPELQMQLSDDESFYTVAGIGTYIDTVVVIPDTYKGKPVKEIGASAFNGNKSITHIVFGSQITEIGPWAFYQCTGLIGATASSIGSWCNIRFQNSYSNPLYYAKKLYVEEILVTDLIIPDEIESINDFSFASCTSIKTVLLGQNVTKIGNNAFHSCSEIMDIKLNSKIEIIEDYAFFGCGKLSTDLYFTDTLIEIGNYAFANASSLPSVYFGSSLKSINSGAFQNCVKLESLIIPASTEFIGKYAFQNCSGVNSVIFQAPSGWKCSHSSYPTSNMGEEALSYPSGAADFLTDTFADREWVHSS